MKKLKLGIVITARDMFPPRANAARAAEQIRTRLNDIFAKIPQVECVYADHLLEEGLLTSTADAYKAADYFIEQHIDALFLPHANFGQEEAVGIVAAELRVPTLIWGPRDGSPVEGEDFRETDTQCGLFASTRVLLRNGLPYTYLRNCWLDSKELDDGIDNFVRAAMVVKQFKGLRVMQISTRPWQFLSVKVNEGELMEKFGIHIVPIESTEIVEEINKYLKNDAEIDKLLARWKEEGITTDAIAPEKVRGIAAQVLAIWNLAQEHQCDTVACECWKLLRTHFDVTPCFAFGYLSQMGLPVSCETDIHGAISSILAQAAALYETPSFLADITVRHPYNENAELLWHCGPFPPVLAKDEAQLNERGSGQYELKQGELTLVRFEVDHSKYVVLAEECGTTEGPWTRGNFIWIDTPDWGKFEDKLMYGPYIHHIAGVYGAYKAVFHEACKYIDVTHDTVY